MPAEEHHERLLPIPPPYVEPFECFVRHYLAHLARRGRRPTLGEIAGSSHLSRDRCRRYRHRHEAEMREILAPQNPRGSP